TDIEKLVQILGRDHCAREMDTRFDPKLSRQFLEIGLGRTIAKQNHMESRVELGRRFEEQRVVFDRRQPCYDSDSKGSIRKAPSAPLRNTRRLVNDRECAFRQKVRNFDDLLPGHPFLADKKIGHTATVRQDTMGEQGAPAIDRLQLGPRYLGPPPPTTGDN